MSLTAKQSVNLRVGQTIISSTMKRAGRIASIYVPAKGARVIEVDYPGVVPFKAFITCSQIETVIS